ncbi:MAG: hydrogenase maturation protease [Candidatus Krumholzibacteriia bacterium]|nr:hydrogenase maturation protease [bacterium]MCB9514451.1 hydrogenase maturation protease [Candidatus Latescibacterota bacterium]MCB9517255.1 hydrogenase maturation protease [Candidatus Latescibacterota bacterium]
MQGRPEPIAPAVAVLGIGSVLMSDDSVGPHVVKLLDARYTFPDSVSVLELGTPGMDLAPYLADIEALIIVDSVRADGPPGSVHCYRREQLLSHPPTLRTTPHDPAIKEALLTAEFAGGGPAEVLLVGVVPASIAQGTELSPAVAAALPAVEAAVLAELERLGCPGAARPVPAEPELWWRRGAPD